MRSRLSLLTLSGLALGTAILAVGTFVRPMNGQPPAPQDGSAKSSGQSDAKSSSGAAAAPDSAAIAKRIEDYLRKYYAWGPNYKLKVGTLKQSPIGDLYEVPVEVSTDQGGDSAIVYVTKDGHYMVRGDMQDLSADPLAENVQKLNLQGAASKGPADAKVVLVEFGDLECPVCRQLDYILRAVLPKYPQVRLVFKDFPLESIHPWAMTAATTGRCVLQQNSDAFWKYHDTVYDSQDVISPENAYDKLTEIAVQSGANADKLKACVADPKTQDEIRQSVAEGKALGVDATPTTFVDGRRLVGPDQALLEQYIQYDSH